MSNRRTFIQKALGLGAGLFAAPTLFADSGNGPSPRTSPLSKRNRSAHPHPPFNMPVVTVDIGDLPYTMDGGTKVFHLIAEPVKQRISPLKTIDLWGFNGSAPGPTIQANQGDRVRVILENHLPEPTSMHWHGLEIPISMDGMPGISQEPVKPGERYVYEFNLHQAGTYFYHSHMAMQEMAGMLGAFILHPAEPCEPHCDKDFLIHLQEYAVLPNSTVPNTMNMEFNWLVLNGKAGPATTPLIARLGDRIRIRFVNLGMDHHPMHLHGHTFYTTGTEGGRIPEASWWPGNTVLVGVAQARTIEFVANNPGDWMIHCHLPHHMMNQMSSNAGIGNISEEAMTNGPLSQKEAIDAMPGMQHEMGEMQMGQMEPGDIANNANDVPNFPQDAYMEGPMMAMDAMVNRPENYGLRAGWSGFMQGMMTFVRVLPPDKYDEVIARMKQANRPNDPYAAILEGLAVQA
jgi:manganese oxidase